MTKDNKLSSRSFSFRHPFFVMLAAIVIAYGGYLAGARIYAWLH